MFFQYHDEFKIFVVFFDLGVKADGVNLLSKENEANNGEDVIDNVWCFDEFFMVELFYEEVPKLAFVAID